jgi:Ni/Co efflux regulator RcnB
MRYLAVVLAVAFAAGSMASAQACPDTMKTASMQVASTDGQPAPQSTKVRIPARPEG